MGHFEGKCAGSDMGYPVAATFEPPVSVEVEVTNIGTCEVVVKLSDKDQKDRGEAKIPPKDKDADDDKDSKGRVSGQKVSTIKIFCEKKEGNEKNCHFKYHITAGC